MLQQSRWDVLHFHFLAGVLVCAIRVVGCLWGFLVLFKGFRGFKRHVVRGSSAASVK